jgi:hypothetical protein
LFRWLCNHRGKDDAIPQSEWTTPAFAKIKEKRTKRLSPYSETEIWDRDELLTIVKYEPYLRNKAALTLCWDMDARNHEVTMLKIKNIRLREGSLYSMLLHGLTTNRPIIYGCISQWKGYSPELILVVKICADAPRLIMLVSNNFPLSGSSLPNRNIPFPLVTV